MAEGFAENISAQSFEIFSAGSRPSGFVHPMAVRAMKELGIDITKHYSKSVHQIPQEKYDAIVTMGCGDACPHLPAKLRIDWNIPDPVVGGAEDFNRVRDLIQEKVSKLLQELSEKEI